MSAAAATMPDMARKKTTSDQSQPGKPNRRPSVTLFARVDPALGQAFNEYVDSLRPRTSTQAVLEMLIEQHLTQLGRWPTAGQAQSEEGGAE